MFGLLFRGPSKQDTTSSPSNTLPPIREVRMHSTVHTLYTRTLQGITVYYNGEVAVVRYIGGFDVSEGTWLGLELKRPCEQHVLLVSMTTVCILYRW